MKFDVRLLCAVLGLCSLSSCFQEQSGPIAAPFRPKSGWTGTLSVVVSQNIKGARRFFEHSIDLDTGQDVLVSRPPEFRPPESVPDAPPENEAATETGQGRHFVSPDGQWTAVLPSPQGIIVLDARGHEFMQKAIAAPWSLNGVAWSPDSNSLALLLQSSREEGLSWRGVLALVVGHPWVVADYKVLLISRSREERQTVEIFVQRDAVAGSAAVHWN